MLMVIKSCHAGFNFTFSLAIFENNFLAQSRRDDTSQVEDPLMVAEGEVGSLFLKLCELESSPTRLKQRKKIYPSTNATHQDYLDGFHRLSNSSAQTEAPSFASFDSLLYRWVSGPQNVAEKNPSNLGARSIHLGQHTQNVGYHEVVVLRLFFFFG